MSYEIPQFRFHGFFSFIVLVLNLVIEEFQLQTKLAKYICISISRDREPRFILFSEQSFFKR